MMGDFDTAYDFMERPDEDGQPFHVTAGDPGGATVYGWTEHVWLAVAPLHGISPATPDVFRQQTKATLKPLTQAFFWNTIQGDRLTKGVDVFWFDFHFTSGGATKVLQEVLGVTTNGVVDVVETVPAVLREDPFRLLDRFLAARIAYYDKLGFRGRWDGLYRRSQACHDLAVSMLN
jgi:lysozyme family protein